jgi:hypothetical protein
MTSRSLHRLAALCAAALVAATPPVASAVDAASQAPTSPDQPKPRVGTYRIVKRGAKVTRAKCLEGGNVGNYKIIKRGAKITRARCLEGGTVAIPTREKATAAQRDRDIHDACKGVDYTK